MHIVAVVAVVAVAIDASVAIVAAVAIDASVAIVAAVAIDASVAIVAAVASVVVLLQINAKKQVRPVKTVGSKH